LVNFHTAGNISDAAINKPPTTTRKTSRTPEEMFGKVRAELVGANVVIAKGSLLQSAA
jgi:hypothetical protein